MIKIIKNINCCQNIVLMLKNITIKTARNHCDKAEGTHGNKFLFFMLLTLECKIFRNVGIIVFNTGALPVSTLVMLTTSKEFGTVSSMITE